MVRRMQAARILGMAIFPIAALLMSAAVARAAFLEKTPGGSAQRDLAQQILDATGVKGGLVVHLGCGDGRLTAALRAGESFMVHGLDTDAAAVEKARQYVQSLGVYGSVSIDRFDGRRLPYVDNLVNLLVTEDPGDVAASEIQRVLCPNGVAYVKQGGAWKKTVKSRPAAMDDWTHYMHDSTGNAVSHDAIVGPPRHLQWVGSPAWTRHHDHMSSFNAMVSAGGRVFYIIDEGSRAEIQLPPVWSLVARDAFNGTVLWKRPLEPWQTPLWPCKSGPAQLPRRMVAIGDTLFVTLGLDAPLCGLDAATGRTIRVYDETRATEEVIYSDGVLFLLVNENPSPRPWATKPVYQTYADIAQEPDAWAWKGGPRAVMAIEADSGKTLWKARSPVAPLTLSADQKSVFFHDGAKVVALDRFTGRQRWSSKPIVRADEIRCWFAPTLVVHQDVVLFAGADKMVRHFGGKDTMTALSAATGEILWSGEHPPSGYDSPEDVLVVDDLVWTAPTTNRRDSGTFTGRDLHTGEVKREFASDCGDHMPHHRCHRAKATDRYILASRTGIEYVDLGAEHWNRNDWVRGACLYGIMPANGLTYAPPQSCACYILAKLNGLNALAPARNEGRGASDDRTQVPRLERGPAYEKQGTGQSTLNPQPSTLNLSSDWPTYRHDAARSGSTGTLVPAELKRAWETQLGGKLTSPVMAEGKVFVAVVGRHTVYALDEQTGEPDCQYTAGGRVDSPPTIWHGKVLFGSADGYVYALRASDGVLAWRFRAAPVDQRLMAFEQLESVWPVHGSVLVHDGIVHCVAGRSMFLDGGMRYLRLDAQTGKLLSETILDNRNPETGQPLDADIQWPNLPVALPDILSCDGRHVYMRAQRFDLSGRRTEIVAPTDFKDQTGEGAHLFSPTGFLDDSWWHRTFWLYGKSALGGAGGWYLASYRAPTGRIMVCDQSRVYSFDRQPRYYPSSNAMEYHLFAASKEPKIIEGKAPAQTTRRNRPAPSRPAFDWSYQVPVLGRALVLAGQTLFVAGPPDVADEELTLVHLDDPAAAAKLAEQAAGLEGRRGAILVAVSVADGSKRAAYRLESMPVFDGMAAAGGCLFLSTTDGKVVCLAAKGQPLEAAADVELTDLPAQTAGGRAAVALTTSHPDFQTLTQVQVASSDLGYRLTAPGGQVGLAIKKLAAPLVKQATFKLQLRMGPKNGSKHPPGNGFLAFGDAADDEHLVKCGLRNAGQQCMIVQGPLMSGSQAHQPVESNVDVVLDLVVAVDLENQKVKMTLLGQTVEAQLKQRMGAIGYIGYCVNSVTSEFSPIEVAGK